MIKEKDILKGQILSLEALMTRFCCANDWSIRDQGIVNSGIWNQVGLELVQIDVQGTVKSQGTGDGRYNLGNQSV